MGSSFSLSRIDLRKNTLSLCGRGHRFQGSPGNDVGQAPHQTLLSTFIAALGKKLNHPAGSNVPGCRRCLISCKFPLYLYKQISHRPGCAAGKKIQFSFCLTKRVVFVTIIMPRSPMNDANVFCAFSCEFYTEGIYDGYFCPEGAGDRPHQAVRHEADGHGHCIEKGIRLSREVRERGLKPAGYVRVEGVVVPPIGRDADMSKYRCRLMLPVEG